MSRAEKIRMKASGAEEIADLLRGGKEHEARVQTECHAVAQVLESLMEQMLGLQKRLDEMLDKNEIQAEEYKAAKNHGSNMFAVVAKALKITEMQKAASPYRLEGMHRALQIVDSYYANKMKQADQAETIDAELDSPEEDAERQARIEARRRRHGDVPENGSGDPIIPDPAEPSPVPPAGPDESENTDPTPPTEPTMTPRPAPPAARQKKGQRRDRGLHA